MSTANNYDVIQGELGGLLCQLCMAINNCDVKFMDDIYAQVRLNVLTTMLIIEHTTGSDEALEELFYPKKLDTSSINHLIKITKDKL